MSILRTASTALENFLANPPPDWKGAADLFWFTLIDGVTNYYWTSWDSDIAYEGHTYSSKAPWLKRSKWGLANTMTVPSLDVIIAANAGSFAGGPQIQKQIHDGLFDGATFLWTKVFMPTPGDVTTLGGIDMFAGVSGAATILDNQITVPIKGKNNLLNQMAPRRVFQTTCNHNFCDVNCTLSAAAFTNSFTVGSGDGGPTTKFIPWSGTPPANPAAYNNGVITFTSGACEGEQASIGLGTSAGLFLAYPLYDTPSTGDGFTAFEGCDKTFNSGSGQSCTDRSNTQHYDGFDFVPQPDTSY